MEKLISIIVYLATIAIFIGILITFWGVLLPLTAITIIAWLVMFSVATIQSKQNVRKK